MGKRLPKRHPNYKCQRKAKIHSKSLTLARKLKEDTMRYYIELPDHMTDMVDQYNHMVDLYDQLDAFGLHQFDLLSDELLSLRILHPMQDTSVIAWLPIDGTITPEEGQRYLLTNGKETTTGYYEHSLGQWVTRDILSTRATHYSLDACSSVRSEPGYYESTQPYTY